MAAAIAACAGCLEAPSTGGADADSGVVASSDATACAMEPGECPSASEFMDYFTTLGAWQDNGGLGCTFADGDGILIGRNEEAVSCSVRTIEARDLGCASAYVHLDAEMSPGAIARFAIALPDDTIYFVERIPPNLAMGMCPPEGECVVVDQVAYDPGQHIHLQLRGASDGLVVETSGPDVPVITWTRFGSFPDVTQEVLSCAFLELENSAGGDFPSTVRFFALNG